MGQAKPLIQQRLLLHVHYMCDSLKVYLSYMIEVVNPIWRICCVFVDSSGGTRGRL